MNTTPLPHPEKHTPCLVCGGAQTTPWATDGVFQIVRCTNCGFVWVNPYFSPEQLRTLYQGYIDERLEDNSFELRNRQYVVDRDFILQFVTSGKILDIGCSGGFFLNSFDDAFTKYGIDVDEVSVNYAQKHCSFGGNVRQALLADADFPDAMFDLITIRGVIQYIHDLPQSIANLTRMLKQDGYLYICATPNVESFAADLYREKWSLLTPSEHLFQFSPDTLTRFLDSHGYKRVAMAFPYLETPYCDVHRDHAQILEDMPKLRAGNRDQVRPSPPFWGNMMNVVFKKK